MPINPPNDEYYREAPKEDLWRNYIGSGMYNNTDRTPDLKGIESEFRPRDKKELKDMVKLIGGDQGNNSIWDLLLKEYK